MNGPLPFKPNFGHSAVLESALFRASHEFGANPSIKLIVGQEPQFERRFPKGGSLFVSILRNFGGFIVPNVIVEGRHKHQRIFQVGLNVAFNGHQTLNTAGSEGSACIREQVNGMHEIVNHERLEDV